MKSQETFKDVFHPDYYTKLISEKGIEEVEKLVYGWPVYDKRSISGKIAIKKYYKEQEDKLVEQRKKREIKAHEFLEDGSRKTDEQLQNGKWQLFAAFFAIVVMIWIAVSEKSG